MVGFQLKCGLWTQGYRTGARWVVVRLLGLEFAWNYPHSSVWGHYHLKLSVLGFIWFAWSRVEGTAYPIESSLCGYRWKQSTGLQPIRKQETEMYSQCFLDEEADIERMKLEYEKSGPHELSPLQRELGMDAIYRKQEKETQ